MKIVHIQGIFSKEHGGPAHSLRNYCIALQQKFNHDISTYVLDGWPDCTPIEPLPKPIKTFAFKVERPVSLGCSKDLKKDLHKSPRVDLYHIHGTWLRALHYGAVEARRRKNPYIIEPMGTYEEYGLKKKWLKKWIARQLFQDRDIARASCLHVNSVMEALRFRRLGFKLPIAVIPAGVRTDEISPLPAADFPCDLIDRLKGRKFIVFLSRIHPKKGIELLLSAWEKQSKNYPDVLLVIAGTGTKDYESQLKNFAVQRRISESCIWAGHVSDQQKSWLLSHSQFMVLPTYSENFGNVVAESLAHGRPVLTTTGTPWSGLVDAKCGWYVEPTETDIDQGLRNALAVPSELLTDMGRNGRRWCEDNFSLDFAISCIDDVYRWLVNHEDEPSCLLKP